MPSTHASAPVLLALALCGCAASHPEPPPGSPDLAAPVPDLPAGTLSVSPDPIYVVTSGEAHMVPLRVTSSTAGALSSGVSYTLGNNDIGSVSGNVLLVRAGLSRGAQTTLTVSY